MTTRYWFGGPFRGFSQSMSSRRPLPVGSFASARCFSVPARCRALSASIQSLRPTSKLAGSDVRVRWFAGASRFSFVLRRLLTKSWMRGVLTRSALPLTPAFAAMPGASLRLQIPLRDAALHRSPRLTGSPVLGPPEEPPTFRSAAFLLVRLQTPLAWVWPLRDGRGFPLPLRFLDLHSSFEEGGCIRSMFRASSAAFPVRCFFLRRRMCASRRPFHPTVFNRSSRTPPVLKLVCASFLPLAVFKDCSSDSQRPPAGVPTDV